MPSLVNLKAIGLSTQGNALDVAEGALDVASNVVIDRDNIVEKRRGFKLYGNSFGTSTDVSKQLMQYRDQLIRHYLNKLQFDNGSGLWTTFPGDFLEPQTGIRIKSVAANNNFYFTTSKGVKKISSATSDLNNSVISDAGGVKAIDISTALKYTYGSTTGFLPVDAAVAYRAVWAIKDVNGNLVLGTPSSRSELYNPITPIMIQDYMRLLNGLDKATLVPGTANRIIFTVTAANATQGAVYTNNGQRFTVTDTIVGATSLSCLGSGTPTGAGTLTLLSGTGDATITFSSYFITVKNFADTNYEAILGLPGSADATDLRTNMIALALKMDTDIYAALPTLTTVVSSTTPNSITFTFTSPHGLIVGDTIKVVGVTPDTFDGKYVVSAVTLTTVTVNTTFAVGTYVSGGVVTKIKYQFITEPDVLPSPQTDASLVQIQQYMNEIILTLQNSTETELSAFNLSNFIDPLGITTTSTVIVTVNIPQEVIAAGVNEYFLQLYRSPVAVATDQAVLSIDVTPNDEMKLVYEAFPTSAELAAGKMVFEDITPDAFAGAFLYSNEATGEGALQVNDSPPLAIDIARFKNVVFYANTKDKQNKLVSLLGVQNLLTDYQSAVVNADATLFPKITITNGTETVTYAFITGVKEVTDITTTAGAALNGKYFDLYTAEDTNIARFYYFTTDAGIDTPPAVTTEQLARIDILTTDSANDVATKTRDALNVFQTSDSSNFITFVFTASTDNIPTIRVVNVGYGKTTNATAGGGGTGFTFTTITDGVGLNEITTITCVADVAGSLNGTYFDVYSANDANKYRFYYRVVGLADIPPAVTTEILVPVDIFINSGAADVKTKTRNVVNVYGLDFLAINRGSAVGPDFRIRNVNPGYTTNSVDGTTGFTITTFQDGKGSSSTTTPRQVLISSNISPATAVDETARALVNIINSDPNSPVNAYYISSANGVPGKIFFQARSVSSDPFYILTNNSSTGSSFNPDLSPTSSITAISSTNPAVVTTSVAHGLNNGDTVVISSSTSPTNIDGTYTITIVSPTSFSIPIDLSAMLVGSYTAAYSTTANTEVSENNTKPNRVMYSKLDQPEAVPLVNFFDVGDSDKAIIRIYPLRDSLFVFKEEGLYRISGENAPFTLALFDSSCRLIASDSLGDVSNLIFAWTKKGIETVSESGASLVSRPIDNDILKLGSSNFPSFKTATFGLGYESDKSYLVWTIQTTSDDIATIAYRYSTVTGAWTTYDKTNTCGIVKIIDDKMYLGAGDTNYTEQERKTFSRLDYADRQIDLNLNETYYFDNQLKFTSVSDFSLGDVLVQEQTLTVFTYNMLLKKLDIDPGIGYTSFFANFEASSGDNMRTKLEDLATQLDTLSLGFSDYASTIAQKTGSIGTQTLYTNPVQITSVAHGLQTGRYINISGNSSFPSLNGNWLVTRIDANTFSIDTTVSTSSSTGTFITLDASFEDQQGSYNLIIQKLNSDTVVAFSNYTEITEITTIESIVIGINTSSKTITFNITLPYVVGPVILFKAYDSKIVYCPVTMGDPLGYKHIREATVMFQDKAFTNAILSFASDLLPSFNAIPFNGDGNGIYGHNNFGEGFFGGSSHGAPFRTYIPRNNQRCRYLDIKLEHNVARENILIYGISLTGEVGYSTRAYRG